MGLHCSLGYSALACFGEPERAACYSQRRRGQPTTPATFVIVSCIRFLRKLESTKRASTPSVAIVLRGSASAACKKTSFNIGQVTATRRSRTVTAQLENDKQYRKMVTEQVGIGFE